MLPRNNMLDWLPTDALKESIKTHWYYLPESIHKDPKVWMLTMQELLCEARSRDLTVTLTITTEN